MPKISSLNVKSVIVKFIVKSLALTTTSIILISSVASFIIFKLDLDLSYCKYAGYLISALTSFIVPFICLKPFKNNILFLSFLSIIPLVLFTLANFIFFGKEFVQLFISLAIIIAVAFVTGVMSAGKRRWLKLSDIPIELKKEFNLEDENEKKRLKEVYAKNEKRYQEYLQVQFNPNEIFKKKEPTQESLSIVEYKESIIKKLVNKIKNIFFR